MEGSVAWGSVGEEGGRRGRGQAGVQLGGRTVGNCCLSTKACRARLILAREVEVALGRGWVSTGPGRTLLSDWNVS